MYVDVIIMEDFDCFYLCFLNFFFYNENMIDLMINRKFGFDNLVLCGYVKIYMLCI